MDNSLSILLNTQLKYTAVSSKYKAHNGSMTDSWVFLVYKLGFKIHSLIVIPYANVCMYLATPDISQEKEHKMCYIVDQLPLLKYSMPIRE